MNLFARILPSTLALLAILPAGHAAPQDPPPFDPTGWTTAKDYPGIGDPNAKRVPGSRMTVTWRSFPPTLRTEGPNSNLVETQSFHNLIWETLVQVHLETEEFIPCLASHWKIETDEKAKTQTFWFHLDPRARWADGSPVTAEDVHKTWWHRTQEDRNDPMSVMTFKEDYEEPQIVDKYTLKVKTRELNWRLFLYFGAGMQIYPAKEIAIPGAKYLEDYNWKFPMGSGPYEMKPEDLKKGESLTVTRRNSWWAENEPWGRFTYNFEKVRATVVRDEELAWEMFKKGELDWFFVTRAQKWAKEIPEEEIVKKGWAKRRKLYNQAPQSFSGLAFNMNEKPFNDRRVRLAFSHLFNRERLMDKLFFNEYEFLTSYFPSGGWGAPDLPRIKFDPDRAEELLEEAGYTQRDNDGFLLGPDGQRFEITLEYGVQAWERIWLVVKEDYEKAGIKLNLKLIDQSTLLKKISERQFKIHFQSWGGILFPNPETSWRSDLADKPANNNIPGFRSAKVDALCTKYNVTFDRAEQKKIVQEIDRLIYEEHPYALAWYGPYNRVLYWDKFGHPANYVSRITREFEQNMMLLWWSDPGREKAMLEAKAAGKELPQGEVVVKPWSK